MHYPSRRCVPLGVLPRLGVVALFAFVLTGCGGGDSSTPSGPAPPPPPPPPPTATATLDFSAIAGDWAGEGNDLNQPAFYQIEITMVAEAAEGDQAGTISYSNDSGFSCGGELAALLANGNTYEFTETITSGTGCFTGGRVRLTYDAAAGTLSYELFHPVTGQLVTHLSPSLSPGLKNGASRGACETP